MKRSFLYRSAAALLAFGALATCGGCSRWFATANALSFGAGWFLRDLTMQTVVERECYVNGELVDCADVMP